VGQLSLLKVLSGTIRNDDHLVNSRTGADERLHGLFVVRGKEHEPVDVLAAGDIGGVAKLSTTVTGDTLTPKGQPVRVPEIETPDPVLGTALVPKTRADRDKLATALHRVVADDAALRVDHDEETGQICLWGVGEMHLAITIEKLRTKFGIDVDTEPIAVHYRQTIADAVPTYTYTHKKQSGGHGQYASLTISVEPLPRGDGFEFVNRVVGGAISKGYIPAVERGIREGMADGGDIAFPVVDLRVTLLDGKEHTVDSSEMAFRTAGSMAIKEAVKQGTPTVLEPVSRLEVTAPSDLLGDVLGDLNARRGRVMGTEPADDGETLVRAFVPESQLQSYATDLRSLTGGRGRFAAAHDHYDVLPVDPPPSASAE
jgi:elongation factor G